MLVDLRSATEFIKDRLYLWQTRSTLGFNSSSNSNELYCINVDEKHRYEPFYRDFGPYHLGHTVLFCRNLHKVMNDISLLSKKIVVVTSFASEKRANAAYLICAYLLICQGLSPEEAYRPFDNVYPPFLPFRDASQSLSTFNLTILDCLKGINRAMMHGFFDLDKFNVEEYFHYERVENGDLNWIIPGKFLAFSSPASRRITPDGMIHFTPEDYIAMFRKWNVTAVIRLNKKMYEARSFTRQGFYHEELFYPDGGLPPEDVLRKFLNLVDEWFLGSNSKGAFAVHCKAGLGRTGTLIGLFMMKYYRFTATEAIAWLRICRPGSVIGIQQHYLKEMQLRMWKEGEKIWKANYALISAPIPVDGSENSSSLLRSSPFNTLSSSLISRESNTVEIQARTTDQSPERKSRVGPSTPKRSIVETSVNTSISSPARAESVGSRSTRLGLRSPMSQTMSTPPRQSLSSHNSITPGPRSNPLSTGKIESYRLLSSSHRSPLFTSTHRTSTTASHDPSSSISSLQSSLANLRMGRQAPIKREHHLATYNSEVKKDDFLLKHTNRLSVAEQFSPSVSCSNNPALPSHTLSASSGSTSHSHGRSHSFGRDWIAP